MSRDSLELTKKRKSEILNACVEVYKTKSFKEIYMKDIADLTSLSKASIYHYFKNKEEIFLAILQREYQYWNNDLAEILNNEALSYEDFSNKLAKSIVQRPLLLKIMSVNHYDMESNSRIENLIEFKKEYGASLILVEKCLAKFFPEMNADKREKFIFSFFPFMFGIYPYTEVSEKQKIAIQKAGINYIHFDAYTLIYNCAMTLLCSSY